jgi:hypothetical protein
MRFGIVGAIIVALSIWLATSERADAEKKPRAPGSHGCASLVTIKHSDLKGLERSAEIKKCNANADAYSKQAGI